MIAPGFLNTAALIVTRQVPFDEPPNVTRAARVRIGDPDGRVVSDDC
jgi:hypothetical protein